MSSGICVGGIVEQTCELIRCHGEHGENLSNEAPFEIGDVWEMDVKPAWNARPIPHIEDRQTQAISKYGNIGLNGITEFIKNHASQLPINYGHISEAFQGKLIFDGYKNYIDQTNIPQFSTQFWVPDYDLKYCKAWEKDYYFYKTIRIKFVGFQNLVPVIPKNTFVRLSLANWWDGDGSGEKRCYLQLSGWY